MASIERIKGSNGNGEAVRATVAVARSSGALTLQVNSVTNFPNEFIGTWGRLNPTTELLEPNSVRVFFGQLNGTDIDVMAMAPGYADEGNEVGDVVLLKPTTAWADELAAVLANGFDADGKLTSLMQADDEAAPKVTFSTSATEPAPVPGKVVVWFEPME